MKSDPRTVCGHQPRLTNSQTNLCLPFCGLGAEAYVQGRELRCGMLQLEPRAPRTGELSGAVTES